MAETKSVITSDVVPVMSKITDHKLNNSNYLDWSKMVRLYLRSIDKDNHLTDDPPKDGNISRIYEVCQAFYRAEKQDKSIMTYFMDFKKTYEELNLLLPFSSDVKVKQTQREQMAIMSFLTGLSPEFEAVKSQILSSPEISSLQDVFSRVFRTENTQSVQSSSALVGFGKQQYKGGGKGIDTRGQNAEVIVCYYCQKRGHMKRDCKKLQYRNQRTQSAHIASTNDAINHEKSVTISADEFTKFSQYQESLKSSSTPVTAIAESGKPNTCLVSSSSKWVIDSGATNHMTGNSSLFSTFQPHTSAPTVTLADGSKSRVLGSSSVNPTPLISLSSVLSLPELSFNLISVSKITRALNCSAQFFPDYCLFQDLSTKQIIGKGLGHPSLPLLKILCPQFQSLSLLDCESCQFAKHHRVNLSPRVDKRADAPFALVHSDVWGSSPVTSKTGFKYFVTFVDDHSLDVTFLENTPFTPSSSHSCQEKDDDLLIYTVTSSRSSPAKPPITQVYSQRQKSPATCPEPVPSLLDPVSSDDLPIALRKGKRQCTYPVSSCVSYNHLPTSSCSFITSIDSISHPKTVHEALSHPGWRNAMIEEMNALDGNDTWNLVNLPAGKKAIGSKWVFVVKFNPDGSVARLKARLVAKGYAQIYGEDYSVRLFISMAATHNWPLHQLDIKNAFLHGDLQEEVYMEQPPGFVAQGESGKVCHIRKSLYGLKQSSRAWFEKFSLAVQRFGMQKSKSDHSVFYKQSEAGIILLVVYVDDIVITGNDAAGKLGAKPASTPMIPNLQLTKEGELLEDPGRYRRLVGKLNYLTVTRPDIVYSVSVVSQYMSNPTVTHWAAMLIRQDPRQVEDPQLDFVSLLEETWSHGRVRSRMLSRDRVQSQNIELWHNRHVKSCG
ncbi:uncharacterized protein [Coffea arabica]|uniref:CCHC-type domain-containing protein n=1 Tax=Coffea arabica TaxID=13443 RepID=A0ABM4U126_COFAR